MSKQLAQAISNPLQAGATVIILQEPDEVLAIAAVQLGAESCGEITYLSGAAEDATDKLMGLLGRRSKVQVLVLSDFLAIYGGNAVMVRLIREVALQQPDEDESLRRLILIESPTTEIPMALRGDVEVVTPSLPTVDDLKEELDLFVSLDAVTLDGNGEERHAIAAAVAGLSRHEASRLFALCWVENQNLDPAWLRKAKAVKVSSKLAGALSFEADLSADVGGVENLKGWLADREAAFGSAKAKAFGLPEPKGLLLLGIPGCGKSLLCKTIAREWKLPLMKLDMGKVFGSLVGQSEGQIRAAIGAAEASAPCVLWIDEIEKGLAGSSGGGDSGTGARVFGTLLTWLQEKTASVFVVATANKIENMPPELLRKGRFDEIFFVDLPTQEEREEITRIHLTRRDRKMTAASVRKIALEAEGFSGAEIEQAIISGLFKAFSDGARSLKVTDVLAEIKSTTPLSRTMMDEVAALRGWADGRARPASSTKKINTTTKGLGRRGPQLSKKG